MDDHHPLTWQRLGSRPGEDLKLFSVRRDTVKNPRNGYEMTAVVLEARDWVNVLAVTNSKKLVVVKQHRFGTSSVTTEFPAGIVEEEESSLQAAERELKEETGYEASDWVYLGRVEPNPAFLDNYCHHWLARGAEKTAPPDPDRGENLEASEMSLAEVETEIDEGRMLHSLAVTALYFGRDHLPR